MPLTALHPPMTIVVFPFEINFNQIFALLGGREWLRNRYTKLPPQWTESHKNMADMVTDEIDGFQSNSRSTKVSVRIGQNG